MGPPWEGEREVGREKGPPWEGEREVGREMGPPWGGRERGRQRDGTTMRREGKND